MYCTIPKVPYLRYACVMCVRWMSKEPVTPLLLKKVDPTKHPEFGPPCTLHLHPARLSTPPPLSPPACHPLVCSELRGPVSCVREATELGHTQYISITYVCSWSAIPCRPDLDRKEYLNCQLCRRVDLNGHPPKLASPLDQTWKLNPLQPYDFVTRPGGRFVAKFKF